MHTNHCQPHSPITRTIHLYPDHPSPRTLPIYTQDLDLRPRNVRVPSREEHVCARFFHRSRCLLYTLCLSFEVRALRHRIIRRPAVQRRHRRSRFNPAIKARRAFPFSRVGAVVVMRVRGEKGDYRDGWKARGDGMRFSVIWFLLGALEWGMESSWIEGVLWVVNWC